MTTPKVDVAALRKALAGFEKLAAGQAHLPVEQRLKAIHTDGTVLEDVVALSIAMCRAKLAEATATELPTDQSRQGRSGKS